MGMYYSIVYYPEFDDERIIQFRKDYDPYTPLIREHVTVVFPIPTEVGLDDLIRHTSDKLRRLKPFEVCFKGFVKSWDHWLLLSLSYGRDEFVQIHNELYRDMLEQYLRKDLEYIPHVGLGFFGSDEYDPFNPKVTVLDEIKYEKAMSRVREMNFVSRNIVREVTIVELNGELTELRDIQDITLGI